VKIAKSNSSTVQFKTRIFQFILRNTRRCIRITVTLYYNRSIFVVKFFFHFSYSFSAFSFSFSIVFLLSRFSLFFVSITFCFSFSSR